MQLSPNNKYYALKEDAEDICSRIDILIYFDREKSYQSDRTLI